MSHCIHRPLLSDYLDGDLDSGRAAAVRLHLEADPPCGCRRELEEMREMVAELGRLAPGPAPRDGWARLERVLDAPGTPRDARWRLVGLAATVLVVVGGLVALVTLNLATSPPRQPGGEEMGPQLLAAAAEVELPPVRIPDTLLVRYAAEIEPIDRLLAALEEMPDGYGQEAEIRQLTALRADLYTELVLQAQATDAASW